MKLESSRTQYVTLLLGILIGCAHQADSSGLHGPYLGQEPPGTTAEIFAPGVVSTGSNEVMFGFFDGGALLFFERTPLDFEADWIHAPVYRTEIADGVWTTPGNLGERINTPGNDTRPYLTTDGEYLFFNSTDSGSRDIYWVDSRVIEDHRP